MYPVGISHNLCRCLRGVHNLYPFRIRLHVYHRHAIPHQLFKVGRMPFLPVFVGKDKQIIDQRLHPERLGNNFCGMKSRLLQVIRGFHQLGKAFDAGQRIADLMGHDRPHFPKTCKFLPALHISAMPLFPAYHKENQHRQTPEGCGKCRND